MTEHLLFYDTETTGVPDWHAPSGGEDQPHIVQLAAQLVDADTRKVVQSIDLIVEPASWEIPQEVVDVHGITTEYARRVGVGERHTLDLLTALWQASDRRIGHGERFDARIVRIAMKRYYGDAPADEWKAGEANCTGLLAKPIMELPPKGPFGYKMPKLSEAYEHFVGGEIAEAHSAMGDVEACKAIHFAIEDRVEAA